MLASPECKAEFPKVHPEWTRFYTNSNNIADMLTLGDTVWAATGSFTTSDGLTDNAVNSILQSDDGALWFGTNGGVSRLDADAVRRLSTNSVVNHTITNKTQANGLPASRQADPNLAIGKRVRMRSGVTLFLVDEPGPDVPVVGQMQDGKYERNGGLGAYAVTHSFSEEINIDDDH
jgi:hypothetical protein